MRSCGSGENDFGGNPSNAPHKTFSLEALIAIAQPYFFPTIRGGGWVTLLLMIMLLVFLFGVLSLVVAAIILAGNYLAPTLTAQIASGLLSLIKDLPFQCVADCRSHPDHSRLVFVVFGRHLRARRRAWSLLAIVLLLSFP